MANEVTTSTLATKMESLESKILVEDSINNDLIPHNVELILAI